ncbi:IclR family transcriptional regulator [Neobacillus niacini]|uniref:IclR family transcriptional regulator n=1 Tax=Neobacillus niacini TaxID=86668 RepID=UPI003000D278
MELEMSGQGIQSLELGINILKKIGEADKPLSISEISELCDISKSKLHRYLTSFCRTGFLQRDSSLHYTIGSDLIRIGNKASKSLDIRELASPTLIRLRNTLNETVFLTIWRGNAPYPIELKESNRSVNIGIRVGYQTSIVLTTSGRLFAAFLPEVVPNEMIHREIIEHHLNPEEFKNELSEIRKNGYSITRESLIPGIVAVGCPVFGRDNKIIATISIVGILGVLDLSSDSELIKCLKKECMELSQSLQFG